MAFEGSCHCGKVVYEVAAELPASVVACNCSHCRRKGFLLSFFPPEQFILKSGEADLESYFFNKHNIEHLFCATCGTESFAKGKSPDGKAMIAVNIRCVPEADLDAIEHQTFDGAHLL